MPDTTPAPDTMTQAVITPLYDTALAVLRESKLNALQKSLVEDVLEQGVSILEEELQGLTEMAVTLDTPLAGEATSIEDAFNRATKTNRKLTAYLATSAKVRQAKQDAQRQIATKAVIIAIGLLA